MTEENANIETEVPAQEVEGDSAPEYEGDQEQEGPTPEGDVAETDEGSDGDEGSDEPVAPTAAPKADPVQYIMHENAQLKEQFKNLTDTTNKQAKEKQEKELMSLMTPEERMEYKAQKHIQTIEQVHKDAAARTQFIVQDASDKAEFISNVTGTPFQKYQGEVEKMYQALVGQGKYVKRDLLLNQVLGQKARDAMKSGAGKKQKLKGQNNINLTKTKGASLKNDVKNNGKKLGSGNTVKDLESRLVGKNILGVPWGNA